ncbi:P-loop containing nucleoside triphosphate hydrolase protein [Rhizodiscina lignyota]|uniref:P-loop containing nucleoside triphosphate hydrolase protein n=1 Tax=Rhizodiscina lignyota TaxID=1504668 RepID=A0A9P4M8R6_9PEZI|nr:P-loop containing nucleoside triphosphate hydrolase protein [Rhizodiscina lignyota]
MSASAEPFTIVSESGHSGPQLFEKFHDSTSAKIADIDVQLVTSLRAQYPDLIVTTIPTTNVNLLQFAAAGYATAELEVTEDDPIIRWRGFVPSVHRGREGSLGENRFFSKYRYTWNNEKFIMYCVIVGYNQLQYVLKEPRDGESTLSNSVVTDALIATIGKWMVSDEDVIFVFDNFWTASKELWKQVQKANWDDVILDPSMKKALTSVSGKFFDSEDVYKEYGVPWKRGLIFHGPVGNGKTISIKALMHTLYQRSPKIPSLYVKSAPYTYHIRAVFEFARRMTPCLLILEDIETIVTPANRSYFFNEVDGLENNDGMLTIATTNYLDRLDPGLSKRPSRFDRKYLFPLPSFEERVLYCDYWRRKLQKKPSIEFPKVLCRPMAKITDDFSFAYLQEAFVATLLVLARGEEPGSHEEYAEDGGDGDLESYELYRAFRAQVKLLREDMGSSGVPMHAWCKASNVCRVGWPACGGFTGGASSFRTTDGDAVHFKANHTGAFESWII